MADVDIDVLLSELDDIEDRCAAGEWDAAAVALLAHDEKLRELLVTPELAAGLNQVLRRQQAVERNLRRWRDEAAATLQRMQRGKSAVAAYSSGQAP